MSVRDNVISNIRWIIEHDEGGSTRISIARSPPWKRTG